MGWFIISRGKPNKRYTPEFKKLVVETMLNEKLSYSETGRRFEVNSHGRIMEHFKQELIDYLDYYNNRRIKAKLKGLPPAVHRQQALSAAWIIFTLKDCITFGGQFKERSCFSSFAAAPNTEYDTETAVPASGVWVCVRSAFSGRRETRAAEVVAGANAA